MPLLVPDGVKFYESDEDTVILAGSYGTGVLSGCAVTAQGAPNMSVAVAAGVIAAQGGPVVVAAVAVLAITAADPASPRIDLVVADQTTGVATAVTGTAIAVPKPPSLPANKVLLGYVSVPAAAVNIQNANITNRRLPLAAINPLAAGTLANRPSASGVTGLVYWASDVTVLYRSNGTTWTTIAGAPMTTLGDIVVGGASGIPQRLGVGGVGSFLGILAGVPAWLSGITVLDRVTPITDVVNTVAETTVYTYAVPGGTIGTSRALRLTMLCDCQNGTGGGASFTVRAKYGGTLLGTVTVTPTTVAGRSAVRIDVDLMGEGAAGFQVGMVRAKYTGTANTASAGNATGTVVETISENNLLAIDSTANQNLVVTVQPGVNSPTMSFRLLTAYLELV